MIIVDIVTEGGTVIVTAFQQCVLTGMELDRNVSGGVVISKIMSSSIFNGSNLMEGMRVLGVNGTNVYHGSIEEVISLLQTSSGALTIEAKVEEEVMVASAAMQDEEIPTAVATVVGTETSPILVDSRYPNRSLSSAPAFVSDDDQGTPIPQVAATPVMMESHSGPLVASDFVTEGGNVFVTVREPSQPSGIDLASVSGGVVIANITNSSLFSATNLRAGMRVLGVNGSNVYHSTAEEVVALLHSSSEVLTIEAMEVAQESMFTHQAAGPLLGGACTAITMDFMTERGTVIVSAMKVSGQTGLTLGTIVNGGVLITNIASSSIFSSTNLRTGMRVLGVNGSNVYGATLEEVAALLLSSSGRVTIEAQEVTDTPTPVPNNHHWLLV